MDLRVFPILNLPPHPIPLGHQSLSDYYLDENWDEKGKVTILYVNICSHLWCPLFLQHTYEATITGPV